jgi:hypothetical protein
LSLANFVAPFAMRRFQLAPYLAVCLRYFAPGFVSGAAGFGHGVTRLFTAFAAPFCERGQYGQQYQGY